MSEPIFFSSEAEWKAARRGLFTSSEIYRLCTNGKRDMTEDELAARPAKRTGSKSTTIECESILSDGAITYIMECVAELIAEPEPEYYNQDMEWGRQNEGAAVLAFAERLGLDLSDPEFLYAGVSDPMFYRISSVAGGSPDVIMRDAIAEVKCPKSVNHLKNLMLKSWDQLKAEHFDHWCQCQLNMTAANKPLCYYISYDPRFKSEHMRLHIIELPADPEFQAYQVRRIGIAETYKQKLLTL